MHCNASIDACQQLTGLLKGNTSSLDHSRPAIVAATPAAALRPSQLLMKQLLPGLPNAQSQD
jgi:hypothetical protein